MVNSRDEKFWGRILLTLRFGSPLMGYRRGEFGKPQLRPEMASDELDGHIPYLKRIALRLTGEHGAADDAVQESIVRAMGRDSNLAPVQNTRAWLCKILTNVCRERWKKNRVSADTTTVDPELHVDTRSPTAETIVGQREHLKQVWEFVKTLPKMQREVLVLNVVERLTHEQIAHRLNTTVGSVKVSLSAARAKLRGRFVEEHHAEHSDES